MKTKNPTISLLKGLAIFSVVCAHCYSIPAYAGEFERACSLILHNLGTLGVLVFFVVSGYLFRVTDVKSFLAKKALGICLPWLVGATAVYLYVALRKPPITLGDYVSFLFGNGSYFYYLTVLMLLYLLFLFLPFLRRTAACVAMMAITVASVFFLYSVELVYITQYLNILNWCGYFALGVFIRTHQDKVRRVFLALYRFRFAFYAAYIGVLVYQFFADGGGGYWGVPNAFFAWLGAFCLLLLAESLGHRSERGAQRILIRMGDTSLFVYIWHMPIAGIVTNLFSRQPLTVAVLARPFVVLGVVLVACRLAELVLKKVKAEKIGIAFGIR